MSSYTFDQLNEIKDRIVEKNSRLVLVAGASASGKSYIAEELLTYLTNSGKKVLLISSDNYYQDNSSLQYLLYGTFDHPDMIEYELLADNIVEYFQTGKTTIPHYSFVEKRRDTLTPVDEQYDILIVEGLYTIHKLTTRLASYKDTLQTMSLFVHADLEEIIFRRIIRDQKRVTEPLHTIIGVMSKVFPMRNVFGQTQKTQADILMNNTFQIMDREAKKLEWKIIGPEYLMGLSLQSTECIYDYIYNDENNENDCVIISEVYREHDPLLRKISLTKQKNPENETTIQQISLDLYQPGILTVLHTLMQLAGLSYISSQKKTIQIYQTATQDTVVIKKIDKLMYILKIPL